MHTATSVYRFGARQYDLTARTHIMGIVNVTPDSFSDGGRYIDADSAVRQALRLASEGADFLDIGGESSRPGSVSVSVDEELHRVIPVIKRLRREVDVPISIDTYKASVAEQALDAGAVIVNDISGFHFDERLPSVVARSQASVILMHIRGTPKTMQEDPRYANLIEEISEYLGEGIRRAEDAGIEQIIVDPGIGFGKRLDHNLEILRRLGEFEPLGYPLLVGPSRKAFIGAILNAPVDDRLEGSAAAVAVAIMHGANIVRVHDVREMKRVAMTVDAIVKG